MKFWGGEIGHGLFVRGDIGFSNIEIEEIKLSDNGFGFLIGSGYGWPINEGNRLLLHINYSMKMIEDRNYGTLNFSVGGLF